jgi:hypothetical protein
VVATSLAVLGTGLGLVLMGSDSFRALAAVHLSMVTLHKASFILWFGVMTLHVLARTVPALRVLSAREPAEPRTSGGLARLAVVAGSLAGGVLLAVIVLNASSWWTSTWQQFR